MTNKQYIGLQGTLLLLISSVWENGLVATVATLIAMGCFSYVMWTKD